MRADSELKVITVAKYLAEYCTIVFDNAPKKYRFSIIDRMVNLSYDVLQDIIKANSILLNQSSEDNKLRRDYQFSALSSLQTMDALMQIAVKCKCLLPNQYKEMSKIISDTQNLVGGWIKSDNRRKTQG